MLPDLNGIRAQCTEYRNMEETDLLAYRAYITRKHSMLGNIPIIASTVPVIFLIFGGHVTHFLPIHNYGWLFVCVILSVIVIGSINYHFRMKGNMALQLYLIDQVLQEKRGLQKTD